MAISSASEQAPADVTSPEVHSSLIVAIREQCPACGVAMAPDQRYCVECGERRGAARVAALDGPASRSLADTPAAPQAPAQGRSMSLNSTLVAGIGTLLLALGVGVLIGRSGESASVKTPPAQVVTVAAPSSAATSTTAAAPATTPTATPTGKTSATSATKAAKASTKASTTAPAKTVKVGSPGKGRGYQHGHFTGNFFGEEG